MNLQQLIESISQTADYFQREAMRQVNTHLTLRNWVIGFYLFEYEQKGQDRAQYGERLYQEIARQLKDRRGFSKRNLHLFVALYKTYPQIVQTLSGQFMQQNWVSPIVQTVSAQLAQSKNTTGLQPTDSQLLVSRLSFSHFIELIQADSFLQRTFYEVEAIKNNWDVRELRRRVYNNGEVCHSAIKFHLLSCFDSLHRHKC